MEETSHALATEKAAAARFCPLGNLVGTGILGLSEFPSLAFLPNFSNQLNLPDRVLVYCISFGGFPSISSFREHLEMSGEMLGPRRGDDFVLVLNDSKSDTSTDEFDATLLLSDTFS